MFISFSKRKPDEELSFFGSFTPLEKTLHHLSLGSDYRSQESGSVPVHLGHLILILNNTSWVSKCDTNEQFTVSLSLPHKDK